MKSKTAGTSNAHGLSVYDYTDYRKFLRDAYEVRKGLNSAFSHRAIAQKAGFKSNGHFSRILSGSLCVSKQVATKLAEVFDLGQRESEYFYQMVRFNQAKQPEEINACFEQMQASRKNTVRLLDQDQHEFYRKWFYTAVREALLLFPSSTEAELRELGRNILPAIGIAEVREAIQVLDKLSLIERNEQNQWVPCEPHLSSGVSPTPSPYLGAFTIHTLGLAMKSVNDVPVAERNHSTISMTLSRDAYAQVVDALRDVRKQIQAIVAQDSKSERVYQLNMNLFPMSSKPRSKVGK